LGKTYLNKLKPGSRFSLHGLQGILLNVSINAEVLITEIPNDVWHQENESYYKGRHTWSAKTLVEEL